jgi:20S proteasome subunit beta 4
MASASKLHFAAHGHASYFCMSTMDRYWKKDMTLEEGIAVLKKCLHELKTRYIVNMPQFTVKVADKDGVREIQL